MKTYGVSTINQVTEFLYSQGFDVVTVEDGVLGCGHIICLSPDPRRYNVEIQEKALNEWSSGHTIRNFDKISRRVEKLLENVGYIREEE